MTYSRLHTRQVSDGNESCVHACKVWGMGLCIFKRAQEHKTRHKAQKKDCDVYIRKYTILSLARTPMPSQNLRKDCVPCRCAEQFKNRGTLFLNFSQEPFPH